MEIFLITFGILFLLIAGWNMKLRSDIEVITSEKEELEKEKKELESEINRIHYYFGMRDFTKDI